MGRRKMYNSERIPRTFQMLVDVDQKLHALATLANTSYHDYVIKLCIAHVSTKTEEDLKLKNSVSSSNEINSEFEQNLWLESNLSAVKEIIRNSKSLLDLAIKLTSKSNKSISLEVLKNFLEKHNLKIV